MARMTPAKAKALIEQIKALDPVRYFMDKATVTQKEVLADNTTYRCVSSSNQGGKTTTAIVECASIARGINPYKPWYGPVNICVFVPSRAQASGVWGDRLLKASNIRAEIERDGVKFDISKIPLIPDYEIEQVVWAYSPQGKYPGYIKLKNGSTIRMALSGDSKSWERVQGFTYDAVYRDEAVGNENLGAELFPRLAAAQTAVEQGKRPWGGFILWVATETLVNEEFITFREHCMKGSPGYKVFFIRPEENPAVSMSVRHKMHDAMSETSGSSMATLRMFGTGNATDTLLIYPSFDFRRHVQPDYEPSPMDNLWVGWDPGIKDEYGLMMCAIRADTPTTLRVTDFFHERGTTLDHQAMVIHKWLRGRTLEGIICDPQAKKHEYARGKEILTIFTEILFGQLKVKCERGVLLGRNRLEDTIPMVKRYLDPDPESKECEPLLVFNERAMYAAQCIAKARLKSGASKAAFNTIEGKNLEAFDLTRYIISRQPTYCPRSPNLERWVDIKASALPKPRPAEPDPLQIRADMSPDQQLHVRRLRESSRMMEDLFGATGKGGRSMGVSRLPW